MGVSILMMPGPIGRNFGKQVNITPGLRSQAASVLREVWGEAPFTLVADHDLDIVERLEAGASMYTSDKENMWRTIRLALEDHGAISIIMQY